MGLWISSPQHRSNTTSIFTSLGERRSRGRPYLVSVLCMLPEQEQQSVVPRDAQDNGNRTGYLPDRLFSSTGGGSPSHGQATGTGRGLCFAPRQAA